MKYAVNYKGYERKALKQKDNWRCYTNVLREVSTRISWIIVIIWPNVTPNLLTVIGGSIGIIGIIGVLLLAIPNQLTLIIGSLILLLWTVLDALDGGVARSSVYGKVQYLPSDEMYHAMPISPLQGLKARRRALLPGLL